MRRYPFVGLFISCSIILNPNPLKFMHEGMMNPISNKELLACFWYDQSQMQHKKKWWLNHHPFGPSPWQRIVSWLEWYTYSGAICTTKWQYNRLQRWTRHKNPTVSTLVKIIKWQVQHYSMYVYLCMSRETNLFWQLFLYKFWVDAELLEFF